VPKSAALLAVSAPGFTGLSSGLINGNIKAASLVRAQPRCGSRCSAAAPITGCAGISGSFSSLRPYRVFLSSRSSSKELAAVMNQPATVSLHPLGQTASPFLKETRQGLGKGPFFALRASGGGSRSMAKTFLRRHGDQQRIHIHSHRYHFIGVPPLVHVNATARFRKSAAFQSGPQRRAGSVVLDQRIPAGISCIDCRAPKGSAIGQPESKCHQR